MVRTFKNFSYLKPYIISEIGVNYVLENKSKSLKQAKSMIAEISKAGGHAAKFQTYKAEKIASQKNSPYYWDLQANPCQSQYELFKGYDFLEAEDYEMLAGYCQKLGIDFLSTPFDLEAVDILAPWMPFIKIASADITNIPLLRRIGSKKKPVILSTGAASLSEINIATEILKLQGAPEISLLHCVLNYPTSMEHAQMSLIQMLQNSFKDYSIGYSDHVPPNDDGSMPALEMAVLLGATVIEKHFTFDKTLKGNDHFHAMDSVDLKKFIAKLEGYGKLYGNGDTRNLEWERLAIENARRRVMTKEAIRAGATFSEENLIALRSNIGIEIAHWDQVLGKKALKDFLPGEPVLWENLE